MRDDDSYNISITQCHILNPYNEELTLCSLNVYGFRDFSSPEHFFDTWCSLEESVANPDDYPEADRCEICWKDEEGRTLILLGLD